MLHCARVYECVSVMIELGTMENCSVNFNVFVLSVFFSSRISLFCNIWNAPTYCICSHVCFFFFMSNQRIKRSKGSSSRLVHQRDFYQKIILNFHFIFLTSETPISHDKELKLPMKIKLSITLDERMNEWCLHNIMTINHYAAK